MIDRFLCPVMRGPLDTLVGKIIESNLSAGQVATFALVAGLAGMIAAGMGAYVLALALILFNRLLDITARRVAARNGHTAFTRYFIPIVDWFALSGFVFFFAMSQPHQALGAGFLLFAYMTLMVSALPQTNGEQPARPFYHFGSLVGGSEIIIFMILVCLYPVAFAAISVLFGTLCFITALGRLWDAAKTLR